MPSDQCRGGGDVFFLAETKAGSDVGTMADAPKERRNLVLAKTSFSKKAASKLGLTTEMLLDNFLGVQAKEELSYDELLVFWDVMGAAGTANRDAKVQMVGRELMTALLDDAEEKKKLRM
jgi:hypothetical protein